MASSINTFLMQVQVTMPLVAQVPFAGDSTIFAVLTTAFVEVVAPAMAVILGVVVWAVVGAEVVTFTDGIELVIVEAAEEAVLVVVLKSGLVVGASFVFLVVVVAAAVVVVVVVVAVVVVVVVVVVVGAGVVGVARFENGDIYKIYC